MSERLGPVSPAAIRLLLVSRDAMLAGALKSLVQPPGNLTTLDWHATELDRAAARADAVVLDLPLELYTEKLPLLGAVPSRTIVLLQDGESEDDLPAGPARMVLYRPLQIAVLWDAVTGVPPAQPGPANKESAPEPGLPPGPRRTIGMSGRELDPMVGPGQVAPGMDPATLDRLRRWRDQATPADAASQAAPPPAPDPGRGRARSWLSRLAPPGTARRSPPAPPVGRPPARPVDQPARAEPAPPAGGRGRVRAGAWLGRLVRPSTVVLLAGLAGLLLTTWNGSLAPDTRAAEVAVAQAAGHGALAVPDQRIGPVSALHALAVRSWLSLTGQAGAGLEATIRAARVPSHLLLAIALAIIAALGLLLQAGSGPGAAAGPGPAGWGKPRAWWRLAATATAALLAAADPLLVASGREASATVLALTLALAALALSLVLAGRPARQRLPLVGAVSGLALLASPLALPTLLVPAVAARLEGRRRLGAQALTAVALGLLVWLALPVWAAGQDLGGRLGQLLGRPVGGSWPPDVPVLSLVLVAAGLAAASWRRRRPAGAGVLAWAGLTAAGAIAAVACGWPAGQALAFAVPAAAVAVALAARDVVAPLARDGRAAGPVDAGTPVSPAHPAAPVGAAGPGLRGGRRAAAAVVAAGLVGLLVAAGTDWGARYGGPDDALSRLVVAAGQLGKCEVVNVTGADARARLLAAGVPVTGFTGAAAAALGVSYHVVQPGSDGPAGWVRERGRLVTDEPGRSLDRVQLWRVVGDPFDPTAGNLRVEGGAFSNVVGSACGGYRVVDQQDGAFYTAYLGLGGKAVAGRPLSSVWTRGPALQAFDTLVLGSVPAADGQRPAAQPVELLLLVELLNPEALAAADLPGRTVNPPTDDAGVRRLLTDVEITAAYLGTDPAGATAADRRRARERFGRPVGPARRMPDGAVRQAFERVVFERPGGAGPARLAPLGQVAIRVGLVPETARRPQPVPGLPGPAEPVRVAASPLLVLLGGGLGLLALGAAVAAMRARNSLPTGRTLTTRTPNP